ncbi:MAG: hypothetical protein AAF547_13920 [Actinomycetota bacterium]
MTVWSVALDDFEHRLDQFHAVLDEGTPPAGLWPPADVIGVPLPPELADRARALLERARQVEGELLRRRAELPTPRQSAVRRRRTPAFSSFSADL